jgi:GTPase involved in cell partitioning and DNA repair
MAGIGGDGGNGNAATGGSADTFSSLLNLIGSDVIATGHNSAGNGGNGHFAGSMVDIDVAIYAPINIAIAGYNSTADAHQTNNVHFDQSTVQMAGIGGDGGHGNTAFGGDFAMHLLSDLHLLDHA